MAARKDRRARAKPGHELGLSDLVLVAEKLEAIVCALDAANLEYWSPFMTYADDLSDKEVAESLELALFDQAIELSRELRQGLTRLDDLPAGAA